MCPRPIQADSREWRKPSEKTRSKAGGLLKPDQNQYKDHHFVFDDLTYATLSPSSALIKSASQATLLLQGAKKGDSHDLRI